MVSTRFGGLFAFLAFVTLLVFPTTTLATTDYDKTPLRDKVVENSCERITEKIDNQIARWEGNESGKHKGYNGVVVSVQNMLKRLEGKGYDLTDLKVALQNLNNAILKRHEDAKVLINLLKDTKQYACGNSEGAFRDALKKAQEQWRVVAADTKEIRNIWQNQVRPEIRKLKEQKSLISPTIVLTEDKEN